MASNFAHFHPWEMNSYFGTNSAMLSKKVCYIYPRKKKISTIFTKSGRSTQAIRHGISWRLEKLCPGVQLGQASWYRWGSVNNEKNVQTPKFPICYNFIGSNTIPWRFATYAKPPKVPLTWACVSLTFPLELHGWGHFSKKTLGRQYPITPDWSGSTCKWLYRTCCILSTSGSDETLLAPYSKSFYRMMGCLLGTLSNRDLKMQQNPWEDSQRLENIFSSSRSYPNRKYVGKQKSIPSWRVVAQTAISYAHG